MQLFQPVTLAWSGREYTIAADAVLRCIAEVENVVTLGDLATMQTKGRLSLAKLAIAYGIALRYAGADVKDEEVYGGMFKDAGAELQRRAFGAILTLQALMVPPEQLRAEPGKGNGGAALEPASSPNTSSSS